MQIPNHIIKMMELTHTFGWLVGVDDKLMCDFCRTCGLWVTDDEYLIVIITPSLTKSLLNSMQSNLNVACTIVNAYTMESYQFKGIYLEHRALIAEEEKLKQACMQGIHDVLNGMGFEYGESYKKYADLDGIAVKMKVNEIFEQTPKKGTGGKIIVKENQS